MRTHLAGSSTIIICKQWCYSPQVFFFFSFRSLIDLVLVGRVRVMIHSYSECTISVGVTCLLFIHLNRSARMWRSHSIRRTSRYFIVTELENGEWRRETKKKRNGYTAKYRMPLHEREIKMILLCHSVRRSCISFGFTLCIFLTNKCLPFSTFCVQNASFQMKKNEFVSRIGMRWTMECVHTKCAYCFIV